MKRRLLSAFLAVMMVLTMAPVAFAADGNDTAENALSSTIEQDTTLNDDYTADITVPAGKTVTLDLGGHTLTNTGSGKATLSVAGNATVKNGTIIGGSNYYNIEVQKGGSLTLENVTATAGNTGSSMIDNWGTLTIKSGTYIGGLNVVKSEEGSTLTINGGTFTLNDAACKAYEYVAVVFTYGTTTITGGTFIQNYTKSDYRHPTVILTGVVEGYTATTEVTGGTFTNNKSGESIFRGVGKATSDNFEVSGGNFNKSVTSSYLKDGFVCKKNITTGMYELTTGATGVTLSESEKTIKVGESFKLEATLTPEDAELKSVTWKSSDKKIATVTNGSVKGIAIGDVTITATPNAAGATPATCKVHVYDEAAQIGETIYPTLEQAIAAVQSGETIKLLKNIQVSKTIEVNKDFSIDLNGFTLTGKSTSSGCRVFTVANSGKLMLTGTGVVTIGASIKNGSSSSVIDVAEGGALAIGEKVTITTGHCNGISVAGTAEMNGTVKVTKGGFHAVTSTGTATIKEGYYNGSFDGTNGTITISGGYFTVDPTEYLATSAVKNKKYIAKAVTGDYKFHVELADENDLQVVPVAGATAAPSKEELKNNKDIPSDKVDNIVDAAKAVSAPEISKAAQEVAANISDNSNTLDKQYQDAAKNEVPNQEKIEVRTYLDVEPKAYNESAYTLDITPKYDVVVVGTNAENEAAEKKVVEGQKLLVKNGDKVQVSIQLPAGFVENKNKLYVQHKGHEYDAAVTANNGVYTANFTNPDGFSEFTISKTSQSVAKVGNNKYTTFQDAVNAVENNGTIEIVGGNKDYTATISGSSKTFTVKNTLDSDITVKVNNDSKTVGKNNGTQSFTYTKPSSGGSSGGSSSGKMTYKVTTSAVNNGGVNASPSSAEKGAAITITLSPDKGYKLDKLTVTDGSGKTVSTVKKSDTVYTFTMPASAVKVGVSYVKATETPSETKFSDVSANDWFASAVDYVTGKGMMNGTADNTFSPKANTTRGMVVTVLYRLENQPSTSAASFTDVASGAYYANAVAWANANGIVSGYGSGKFGPNDKVTREQLAAILYRYAQYKKYDVSGAKSLDGYTDAQSVSSYAVPALQWANAAGVVTGKSGSKLDPKGNATRAEVAAMLMRFCENVK